MSIAMHWQSGERSGHGLVRELSGERLLVEVDAAIAPGAPVKLLLQLTEEGRGTDGSRDRVGEGQGELGAQASRQGPRGLQMEGKSQGARRIAEGRFELRLRLVNLRRVDRITLEQTLGGA